MKWEELPLADRAKLMAAAVRNGYTDIRSIKEAYANYQNQKQSAGNRYAEGGDMDEDSYHSSYNEWKEAIAKHHHLDIDNDNTYDYMGFYYSDPARAWAMLDEDSDSHFTDEFKTAAHPTFSNLSTYSGKYDPVNNPLVATGGTWTENPNTFTLPEDWYKGPSIPERINYLERAEDNGVTMFMPDGSLPVLYNNEPWGGVLPAIEVTNQNAYGGNLFRSGGDKSKQSKKDYYRQQLIIRGLRGAQLEAVLANMEVESGFNPGAHNKSSGAHGLMQWLGSRKPKSWSEKDQLDYIAATYNKFGGNEWLDKNAWKRFNETTDPAEAARLFRRYWERPEKSSWYATDKLFKGNKGSYLPQETNDIIQQVASLEYNAPKGPIFTEADQTLLDTPALAFYNPEYEDRQSPDYKESGLAEATKLDESLWNNHANGWALYNSLLNAQSQNDPLSWMTTMASLSPKTTPQQKEAANTMYQLFAPQGDDYMYHGLNFAAYGGKINPNNSLAANSHLLPFGGYTNAINAINQTGEGYHYIIDGQTMNRKQALDYINKHKNETYAVNRYSTTSSTAGKQNEEQNWQTLDANGKWIDNNEYHPDEGLLDEVVITHPYTVNNALSQDRTYLQHNPIADLTITPTIDLTNTDQNMFHRRDVANADASVRESMSSDVVDNIYDYMMPSTWAGLADKALEGGYNFNQLFNPTYDNQGWVGLFGADQWAKEHPEATTTINTGIDLMLPYGIKGTKAAATSTPIMNYRLAKRLDKALGPSIKQTERIIPGELSPYESAVAKYSNSVNIPTGRMNWLDRLYYDALKNNDARTIKTLTEYQYATRNGILPTRVYHGSPKTDIHQFAGRKVLNSGYSDGTFLFPEEFSQNANYYISKFGRRDGKVYPLFMPMDKFKEIIKFDGLGRQWNAIPEKIAADAFGMTTKELHDAIGRYGGPGLRNYSVNQLARLGSDMEKDMVIANNIRDAGPIMNQTQYMLMKPQTLKLQNPVTFDDTGNIIPLSQRFNLDIYDTRYAEGGNLFRKGGKKNNAVSVGGVTAGSQANTEQCAKYSNAYLRDNGYIANGNAWNQGGGSVVFSGYDGLERPAVFDKKAVEAYNNAASDNVWNNFDSNTLDKDSVYTVNMYYKGSPYLEEAYKNGTKGRTGTHTGYLKYENGDWYVVHNIHGKVHVDKFTSIQGGNRKYGVTGIYAPRTNNIFNRAITKLGFADGGYLLDK